MSPNGCASPTLKAALAYLDAGLSILPIARDGSKRPDLQLLPRVLGEDGLYHPTWAPFQKQPAPRAEIERWFRGSSPPGIGVINGAVSGALECIDFDYQAERIFPEWRELVEAEAPGLVDRLSITRTPKGGFHVRYRCPGVEIEGNTKLAVDPAAPKGEKCLIETRGEGGYALAAGSPAECHETKRLYVHESGPPIEAVQSIGVGERETLLRCARSFDRSPPEEESRQSKTRTSGLSPGDDYDQRGPSWREILEPHGWEIAHAKGSATYWRRPGKRASWSATTGVCTSKNGRDLLAVFSSNAEPFPGPSGGRSCSTHSKFSAFAILNHNGDFAAAAKELAANGFGEKTKPSAPPKPDKWEPFTPFGEVETPLPFPTEIFPVSSVDFVDSVARSIGCPEDFIGCFMLGVAAGAIGASRILEISTTWRELPQLTVAVIGTPGSGKSPALKLAAQPLHHEQGRLRAEFDKDFKVYELEHEEWKGKKAADRIGDPPTKPTLQRMFVNDATTEALAGVLLSNRRGVLVLKDELIGLITSMNAYRSGRGSDRQFWLSLWSGEPLSVERKNADRPSLFVPTPCAPVVGGMTPDSLPRLRDAVSGNDGFIDRILFSFADARPVAGFTEATVPLNHLMAWSNTLTFLWKLNQVPGAAEGTSMPRPVYLTDEARVVWRGFVNEIASEINGGSVPDILVEPFIKMKAHGGRLALVIHLLRVAAREVFDEDIDAESVRRAVLLVDYFKSHARKVYQSIDADPLIRAAKKILAWMVREGRSHFTRRDAHMALVRHFATVDQLDAPLGLLTRHNYIRAVPEPDRSGPGRRPSPVYEINPGMRQQSKQNQQN